MYRRLLVPVDGSAAGNAGLQEAIRIARSSNAGIRLLHVISRLSFLQCMQPVQIIADVLDTMEHAGRDILASARARVARERIHVEIAMRRPARDDVAETIAKEGKRSKADLVVMGTQAARGSSRIVLGTTTTGVLRHGKSPVLLVPPPQRSVSRAGHSVAAAETLEKGTYRRILVPFDGSQLAKAGLREALRLCKGNSQAAIRLLHILEEMPILRGMALAITQTVRVNAKRLGEQLLKEARATVEKRHRHVTAVFREAQDEGLARVVVDEAGRWKADVIVMGTHGRRGIGRVVLGSDAESVVSASRIPILLVRS